MSLAEVLRRTVGRRFFVPVSTGGDIAGDAVEGDNGDESRAVGACDRMRLCGHGK